MSTILTIATIAVMLLAIATYLRDTNRLNGIITLFLILIVGSLLQSGVSDTSNYKVIGILASIASINCVLGTILQGKIYKWAIPAISLILLPFIGGNDLYYGEYSLDLSQFKITSIAFMGFAIGLIAHLIRRAMKALFYPEDVQHIELTAQIALAGVTSIFAIFLASYYGLFILAIGFYLYESNARTKNSSLIIGLLALATIAQFASLYSVEAVDLSMGKVIAGFLFGAASYSLIKLGTRAAHKITGLALILLAFVVSITILKLDQAHPAYGGLEGFLASIAGFATVGIYSRKDLVALITFPLLLSIGFIFPEKPIIKQEKGENSSTSEVKQEEVVEPEIKGQSVEGIIGKFEIDPSTALIEFQLGPKGGITKGVIKGFEGNAVFSEDLSKTSFMVVMPTKNLTTYNSMRDESVMSADYLNEKKHPAMKFVSKSMEVKDDGYVLKGQFTLLGKTANEEVFIKYIGENNGKKQFIGNASVNRTDYGMKSSPQEGNDIDFTFKIELK